MDRPTIDTPESKAGAPVIKPNNIGSYFTGALATSPEMRDQRDENGPKLKDDGSPFRELVLHLVCIDADCTAGSIESPAAVVPGQVYRAILKGGAWGQWIDATKGEQIRIGDTISFQWDHAQAYEGKGKKSGGEITDPNEVTRRKQAGQSVGIYGPISWSADYDETATRIALDFDKQHKDTQRPAADDPFPASTPAASTSW